MKHRIGRTLFVLISMTAAVGLVWAIPGYHINDDVAADKSVQQFADDSYRFRAVVYQAELDESTWRLALAAHKYAQLKPADPQRECSFSEAYWSYKKALWRSQQANSGQSIPPGISKELENLYEPAIQATRDAVQKMPDSVAVHLNYGNYLQYFGLMDKKENIQLMLNEYTKAVTLRPDLGYTHYALAGGYMGSGRDDAKTTDKIIAEFSRAVALDPRLTDSYYALAAVYVWPTKNDFVMSRHYLDKYLKLCPQEVNSPRVLPLNKYLHNYRAN